MDYIYTSFMVMNDGSKPLTSYTYTDEQYEAMLSRFHQELSYAYANLDVVLCSFTITKIVVNTAFGIKDRVEIDIIRSDGFNREDLDPDPLG